MPIQSFNTREHGSFVYSAFSLGSGLPRETLDRLFDLGAKCVVLTGHNDPTWIIGFAIVIGDPQTVAWVYVRLKAARDSEVSARRQGFAKAMLEALGTDTREPMTALFWSPVIAGLKRRGYVIRPPQESENAA